MTDRIHPESIRQIEQLIKLHGAPAVLREIERIETRHYERKMTRAEIINGTGFPRGAEFVQVKP